MSELPSLPYDRIVRTRQLAGFVVVRQRGSHIRLQKRTAEDVLKVTVPAHRPVKKGTLSHILKAAQISVDQFNFLL